MDRKNEKKKMEEKDEVLLFRLRTEAHPICSFNMKKEEEEEYLRISVVMMRQADSGLSWTSPVRSPTSLKVVLKSLNF